MGLLPREIAAISSLKSINLNENGIEGIIPSEWSKLTNLGERRVESEIYFQYIQVCFVKFVSFEWN